MNPRITASSLLALTLLSSHSAPAFAKPKYGPDATPISESRDHFRNHPAPDFWALIPYYAAQQTGSACSIASAAMVVNAARAGQKLSADEELVTQKALLKRLNDPELDRAVDNDGAGRTLDQLAPLFERALKAYGFPHAAVEAIHVDDESPSTKSRFREALLANEKDKGDFIVLNFSQGAVTGDSGGGHVAPIAAYDGQARRALVMDPDREWYEPYWATEASLIKAMRKLDLISRKSRGYLRVRTGLAAALATGR